MRRRDLLGPASALIAGTTVAATPPAARRAGARRRLSLALGSGSMHGLAHIGMQRALKRLRQPVPVDVALQLGAEVVLAVDLAYRPSDAPASGLTGVAFQTLPIMINALVAGHTRRADLTLRLSLHHLMRQPDTDPGARVDAGDAALTAARPRIERLLTG